MTTTLTGQIDYDILGYDVKQTGSGNSAGPIDTAIFNSMLYPH